MVHMLTPLCIHFSATAVKCGGADFGMQVRQYMEPRAGTAVPFKPDKHEALHKYFIKRLLGDPSTPDLAIYGEVARLPSAFFRLQMIVKYWNILCGMAIDRLLGNKPSGECTLALWENSGFEAFPVPVTIIHLGTSRVCCTKLTYSHLAPILYLN
jgi:hypothetical protein